MWLLGRWQLNLTSVADANFICVGPDNVDGVNDDGPLSLWLHVVSRELGDDLFWFLNYTSCFTFPLDKRTPMRDNIRKAEPARNT